MTDLLSEDELAGLKALADAATPGPWLTPADDIWDMLADGSPGIPLFRRATSHDRRWGRPYEQDEQIANAAFIAGFNPQTALRLLHHIDALKAERWEPIETAPLNTPIEGRMGNLVATIVLRNKHIEEDHYEIRADIKHYNGETLYANFRGPFDAWRPLAIAEVK